MAWPLGRKDKRKRRGGLPAPGRGLSNVETIEIREELLPLSRAEINLSVSPISIIGRMPKVELTQKTLIWVKPKGPTGLGGAKRLGVPKFMIWDGDYIIIGYEEAPQNFSQYVMRALHFEKAPVRYLKAHQKLVEIGDQDITVLASTLHSTDGLVFTAIPPEEDSVHPKLYLELEREIAMLWDVLERLHSRAPQLVEWALLTNPDFKSYQSLNQKIHIDEEKGKVQKEIQAFGGLEKYSDPVAKLKALASFGGSE